MGQHARRVAATGLVAALLAVVIISVHLGFAAREYRLAEARATAVADGVVVADGLGDEGDVRVRWVDAQGEEHEQRFGIYNTERYTRGASFDVRYDPAQPSHRAFPAALDETAGADDLQVPILLAIVAGAIVALSWAVRVLGFFLARRRTPLPAQAAVLYGEHVNGGLISLGLTSWLGLAARGRPVPQVWQRVMWHPELDGLADDAHVLAHGDLSRRRRVAVTLPSGTLLVPIGRLRHGPPRTIALLPSEEVSQPSEASRPPPPWWQRPLIFAAVGVVVGAGMSFSLAGGGTSLLPFAAAMSGFLVNVWAFAGTRP